jgi:ACT domain-containing protein
MRLSVSVPDRPGSLTFVCSLLSELRANVMETIHDRSFSQVPGNVEISFLLEVRDRVHKDEILAALRSNEIDVRELH